MLTIFTTCKPCNYSNFELQQRNAMKSWTFLKPKPQVLVMGNDYGAKEIADDYGFKHVPNVKISDFGTPMLDDMFRLAEKYAEHDHLALVSSDVFLFQSTMKALEACKAKFNKFCGVCRKKQQQTVEDLDFSNEESWHATIRKDLRWNLITSGDFYMFSKGFWGDKMPPFIIGRCACDSWLFWEASQKGLMIDFSMGVEIIDYKHNHEHWKKKKGHGEMEKKINLSLAREEKATIRDSNWILTPYFQIIENELKKI